MIPFVKAHACGNDFLIIDVKRVPENDLRAVAVRLCARTTGIGADGVEYLAWTGERSGRIRLFNADGSIAEISGNGTRCAAALMAYEKRSEAGDGFAIETDAGLRRCQVVDVDRNVFRIATDMGIPRVSEHSLVLSKGTRIQGAVISLGNPHFVLFTEDASFAVDGRDWESIGREICFHPDFPQQTNVEFVHVTGPSAIEFRIFERGVGPTTSSGTGSCASAAASIVLRGLQVELLVTAPGGPQSVTWPDTNSEMVLIGPAELLARGEAF